MRPPGPAPGRWETAALTLEGLQASVSPSAAEGRCSAPGLVRREFTENDSSPGPLGGFVCEFQLRSRSQTVWNPTRLSLFGGTALREHLLLRSPGGVGTLASGTSPGRAACDACSMASGRMLPEWCQSRWLHTTKGRSQTSDGHLSCSVTGQTPKDRMGVVSLLLLCHKCGKPTQSGLGLRVPEGFPWARRCPLPSLAHSGFSHGGCWPQGPLPHSLTATSRLHASGSLPAHFTDGHSLASPRAVKVGEEDEGALWYHL